MNKNLNQIHALIYNRVSSKQQEKEGAGLQSQEKRCIKYAEAKGYIIEKTFHDTFTGGGDFMKRPAMRELLAYIDENKSKKFVVIFDDLKRFARDTKFHIELRAQFNRRKTIVECLNFNFEDTPEGTFVETILAAQNQLEREQNKRQVIQKMKARLESGYWAFPSPSGYTMKRVRGYSGKILIKNDKAHIVKETLEGFADLRFTHLTEIAQFLKDNGVLGIKPKEKYIDRVKELLMNPVYTGHIEYLPWNVTKREGIHEPIISRETYNRIQERLNESAYIARIIQDRNEDFELRRLVSCIYCGNAMTSCFSRGRNKRYPYYLCQTRGCKAKGKSVKLKDMDSMFRELMEELKPSVKAIKVFSELFDSVWNDFYTKISQGEGTKVTEIAATEADIEKYIDLAGTALSDVVRQKYEAKIDALAAKLELLQAKGTVEIDCTIPYRTALERVLKMAEAPYKFWQSCSLEEKKRTFFFFFDANILYDPKTKYRTKKESVLYRFLGELDKNSGDVDLVGNLSNQFTDLLKFVQQWSRYPQ